jgi:hypothetical protein
MVHPSRSRKSGNAVPYATARDPVMPVKVLDVSAVMHAETAKAPASAALARVTAVIIWTIKS